ncbi:unnamed protein product [Clonostachys rosea]|uniref:Uncharacterized protein n=1 Tax=Bionectria ochroleuca TaxID=29856 RepID=A0ABY6TY79_BIOOC|nr:unnamed protein product [Clonostachys rosea]
MDPSQGSVSSVEAAPSTNNPTTVPRIRFQTAELLAQEISKAPGDILYVEDVSPHDFSAIDKYREDHRRKYRFRRYYPERSLLIIAITKLYHEVSHVTLYQDIVYKFSEMGLRNHWVSTGGATFEQEGDGKLGSGEADSTGCPIEPGRRCLLRWPMLVIETGYSQSLQQLRDDSKWWFEESNHQVKIVVLIKLHTGPLGKMTVEQWRERPIDSSSGQLEPVYQQVIDIAQISATANRTLPLSYSVTESALELKFSDLFLRDPGHGEGNIVIEIEDLQGLAAHIGHSNF